MTSPQNPPHSYSSKLAPSQQQKQKVINPLWQQPQSALFLSNFSSKKEQNNQLKLSSKQSVGNQMILPERPQNKGMKVDLNLSNNPFSLSPSFHILIMSQCFPFNQLPVDEIFFPQKNEMLASNRIQQHNLQNRKSPMIQVQKAVTNSQIAKREVITTNTSANTNLEKNFINRKQQQASKVSQIQYKSKNNQILKTFQKSQQFQDQIDNLSNQGVTSQMRKKNSTSFQTEEKESPKKAKIISKEKLCEKQVMTRKRSKVMEVQQQNNYNNQFGQYDYEEMQNESQNIPTKQEKKNLNPPSPVNLQIIQQINKSQDNKFGQEMINDLLIPKLQQLTIKDQKQTPKQQFKQEIFALQNFSLEQSNAQQKGKRQKSNKSNLFAHQETQAQFPDQIQQQFQAFERAQDELKQQQIQQNIFNHLNQKARFNKQKQRLNSINQTEFEEENQQQFSQRLSEQNVNKSKLNLNQEESPKIQKEIESLLQESQTEQLPKKNNKTQRKFQRKCSSKLQINNFYTQNEEVKVEENLNFGRSQQPIENNPEQIYEQSTVIIKKQQQQYYPSTPQPPNNPPMSIFQDKSQPMNYIRQCQSEDIQRFKNYQLFTDQGIYHTQNQEQSIQFSQNQYSLGNSQNQFSNQQQAQSSSKHFLHSQHIYQFNDLPNYQQYSSIQDFRNIYPVYQYQVAEKETYQNNQYQIRTLFGEDEEEIEFQKQEIFGNQNNYPIGYTQEYPYYPFQQTNNNEDDDKIFEILGEIKEEKEQVQNE